MADSEQLNNAQPASNGADTPSSPTNGEQSSERPPSLRPPPGMAGATTSSPNPLANVNAQRRPGAGPARASNLTGDIQKRMKEMMLSRQGAAQSPRPGMPASQPPSTNNIQTPTSPAMASPALVPGRAPTAPPPAASSPRAPKGPIGGLAAKRKNKPGGGLKLSDALKPPEEGEKKEETDSGSQFNKFANIVDTQSGTLTFKDKAVLHGSGIDFQNGSTFSISLDEVDTMDELGKGNYGTVFKVRHARPKMRKPGQGLRGNMQRQWSTTSDLDDSKSTSGTTGLVMAMKEIRLELEDSKFAQIVMELDILHRCQSPFIIDFYGAFFQEGSVYICIEFMDGGSIDKIYGDGVPEGVLRKITLATVIGLKYLKDEHNIIHRDVKPTNILVNTRGQIKICDFGVSGNLVASMARTNIGCQSYMAPERISGGGIAAAGAAATGSYSVQSDIWSLGLTIIECAYGRYPYPPETYNNIFAQLSVSLILPYLLHSN